MENVAKTHSVDLNRTTFAGYRLFQPTMALVLESGRQVARSLPVGTLFGVVGGKQSPQSEFIEVIVEGNRILMFAVDIRRKARKLRKDSRGLQVIWRSLAKE